MNLLHFKQPTELRTARLNMRNWRESDRAPFAAMGIDPEVMKYFPSPISRAESDRLIDHWFSQFAERGWGIWAVETRDSHQFIGFVGLYATQTNYFPFSPCVEIAWRLRAQAWGKGYATEAAHEILRFSFEVLHLPEIVSFTALNNKKSSAVMERIGMQNARADFDHPKISDGHALQQHCLYRITEHDWKAAQFSA